MTITGNHTNTAALLLRMTTPAAWDSYIGAATTFALAQDRMAEALAAGVSLADLLTVQSQRIRALSSY